MKLFRRDLHEIQEKIRYSILHCYIYSVFLFIILLSIAAVKRYRGPIDKVAVLGAAINERDSLHAIILVAINLWHQINAERIICKLL